MSKQIINSLEELVEVGIIDQKIANDIEAYYQSRQGNPVNKILLAFGVIGALMIGGGIILLVAHNWDNLSRSIKTVISFAPLIIGQLLCLFALLKKDDRTAWRESTATFTVLAIGASIALVSQTYHLPGSMSSFLSHWLVLALPVIYLMRSSMASLLYLLGFCGYSISGMLFSGVAFWQHPALLFLAILPHYILQVRRDRSNPFTLFHHWLIPLAAIRLMFVAIFNSSESLLMTIPFACLFALYYQIGNTDFFKSIKTRYNGYKVVGLCGALFVLFSMSFIGWSDIDSPLFRVARSRDSFWAIPLIIAVAVASIALLGKKIMENPKELHPMEFWHIAFAFILLLIPNALFINILILAIGLWLIWKGSQDLELGSFNLGLLMIMVLIGLRFVMTDVSFVVRGVAFIAMGIGFLLANLFIAKQKQAKHES